ncbi:diaminopimelate decarboxylase [Verrucomicrobia bacterium]|jgi:diaminopimelate decarboxylase|nr:diaminopimelate decarboxylase [Verrucomicrobiota bacterium]MDA7866970.1 diaminopimelate decarboxylase [Verrucomicrobiota bacterium]MDB4746314.1 diaminopimelate decarboxylase [Verrucomicrobiota bacterium]MDB4798590.1 diaminopimelate decarboxylase [Verrucomicrobiota bacterium]
MHEFQYTDGELFCEQVPLSRIAAKHGTPCYVYSHATIKDHFQKLDRALSPVDHTVCYAVKANSNLAVLKTIAKLGGGFDVVSKGEIERVVAAGGDHQKCIFAGVGKTEREIEFALRLGIYAFNAESEAELERINAIAKRLKKKAPISVRVNPNIDAKTHAKITTGTYENKFGIAFEQVKKVYAKAAKLGHLHLKGVQMHIGSQLTTTDPFEGAVKKLIPLVKDLKKRYGIEFFSIGGGLGIVYEPALESGSAAWWKKPEAASILTPQSYADRLVPLLEPLGVKILVEPGRFIAGNAGVLITRVEYIKRTGKKNFVIVDAAMNDLIRPAFYEAYHDIVPLKKKGGAKISSDVVGPICESGDTFCKNRPLPRVKEGDYLALLSAGAYAFVMASNYNTRPMPPEVMVKGKQSTAVRERETPASLWAHEKIPSWLK